MNPGAALKCVQMTKEYGESVKTQNCAAKTHV
jgi:hypothetical protein